ncbi:zinc ribbon domain-containing protein [candidate division CSSED10-310 bacterium]|uniref:Zinc ribbon domain-containing protein n=1 Tax=candidate division CSSED10-310 bacterium TaxID=2855610 RepID=A0ABV6YR07_UNCC1
MLQDLENLLLLQAIDAQIKEAEQFLDQIPEEIKKFEQEQQKKDDQMDNIKTELDEQSKLQRKLEAELQDNEEKLIKLNVQLNQLKSNDEYRTMLKQIETIKYQNSEIENAILETLEDIDAQKITRAKFKIELGTFRTQTEKSIAAKQFDYDEKKKQLEALMAEAQQTRGELENGLLAHYDKLKTMQRRPMIAHIKNDCCGGCHMTMRPKVLIELRRSDVINYCENCFRFLYWKHN